MSDSNRVSSRSSLLSRARQRRDEVKGANRERDEAHFRHERLRWIGHVRAVLELDSEAPLALESALSPPRWEDNLWAFELEGLDFIVGSFWHGNPGRSVLLAVKIGKGDKEPEWPPPHPRSVHNTGWAPEGYAQVNSLWQLAEAVDGGPR